MQSSYHNPEWTRKAERSEFLVVTSLDLARGALFVPQGTSIPVDVPLAAPICSATGHIGIRRDCGWSNYGNVA